jgi:thiamine kinase-like enzyme
VAAVQTPRTAGVTLDDVIARMGWAARRSVTVSPLSGGITNLNYRVDVDGESFVVRMPGQDSENLGIDRRREHACNVAAHEAGVAPEPVAFFEDEGVQVARFAPGCVVQAEKMHVTSMLVRVAAALRRYHTGRPFPGVFSPFQAVRDYLAFSEPRGAPLPARFGWMRAQADRLEGAIGTPATLRPCHNDLLLANWIEDGERLWIIDWEYAAMGDIYFDLGNFAVHMQLTDDEEQDLIRAYFGDVGPGAVARLKLMKIISDLREAMWAMVQVTISTLDYDFVAYGTKHFNRYTAQLRDPRLEAWLRDAPGAPDLPGI